MGNLYSLMIIGLIFLLIFVFDRKKFKREGVFFLRRTKRGLKIIDRLGKKHSGFFRLFGELGVILSFGGLGLWYIYHLKKKQAFLKTILFSLSLFLIFRMVISQTYAGIAALLGASGFITSYLIKGAYELFTTTVSVSSLQLVLPIHAPTLPVYYVPIGYWLISILVLIVVHEFSHAFVSRAQNIRIKSLGYGFLGVLPLAFAEPDEVQLKKTGSLKKTRVYAAGSFSNILVGILALIIGMGLMQLSVATFESVGVEYQSTIQEMPAFNLLPSNGTITKINGNVTNSVYDLALIMQEKKPNEIIQITVNDQEYSLKLSPNPENVSKGFMGVSELSNKFVIKENIANSVGTKIPWALIYLLNMFKWLFLLNIGIGLANLLPIKPLDGGLMLEEILKKINPKHGMRAYRLIATMTLGLIFLNLFGPYII